MHCVEHVLLYSSCGLWVGRGGGGARLMILLTVMLVGNVRLFPVSDVISCVVFYCSLVRFRRLVCVIFVVCYGLCQVLVCKILRLDICGCRCFPCQCLVLCLVVVFGRLRSCTNWFMWLGFALRPKVVHGECRDIVCRRFGSHRYSVMLVTRTCGNLYVPRVSAACTSVFPSSCACMCYVELFVSVGVLLFQCCGGFPFVYVLLVS